MTRVSINYQQTEKQRRFHESKCDEVLFGGAAGGGKSRAIRAEAIAFALQFPGSRQAIFRRTYVDLTNDMVPKLQAEIPTALGKYNAQDKEFRFINGSVIRMGYIERDSDVYKWQGAELQQCFFDEATQFTEYQVRYLMSRLRAAGPVRDAMDAAGIKPRLRLSANPGGIGHQWVKSRYIDPAPPGTPFRPAPTEDDPNPGTRLFIPAKLDDNPHLDASYSDRLDALDPDSRRALKFGDWDAYQGQAFREWRRDVHTMTPEEIAEFVPATGGVRAVGVDYGASAPFAALWGTVVGDGIVVVYREQYQAELTPTEQAELIRDSERPGERTAGNPVPVYLDPATWARSPDQLRTKGPGIDATDHDAPPPGSIAHTYRQVLGTAVVKARNDRLAGIAVVRDRLRVRPDGFPRLIVSTECRELIRTLPSIPRDPKRPEDVDTKSEDHAYDALRYLLMGLVGKDAHAQQVGRRGPATITPPPAAGVGGDDIGSFRF